MSLNAQSENVLWFLDPEQEHFLVWCPGCETSHVIWSDKYDGYGKGKGWKFNGDLIKPTFRPSLLVRYNGESGQVRCHSFIRDGVWEYLNDCTHKLSGRKVPMKPHEEDSK